MRLIKFFIFFFLSSHQVFATSPEKTFSANAKAIVRSCMDLLLGDSEYARPISSPGHFSLPHEAVTLRELTPSEIANLIISDPAIGRYTHTIMTHSGPIEIKTPVNNTSLKIFKDHKMGPLDLINPEELKGKNVLVMGCGLGSMVMQLRRWGIEAYGHEVKLSNHQKQFPEIYTEGTLTKTPFLDGQFDLIIALGSLYSVNYLKPATQYKLVDELSRNTKPGGKILITPTDYTTLSRLNLSTLSLKISNYSFVDSFRNQSRGGHHQNSNGANTPRVSKYFVVLDKQ